ncbi:MAG: large-conductance mechanosensitive channel protein MscL [Clostridia bacterium]|nr:large-conductance mechanosensitive channel protein MscL [Clostridia bacterium]
MWSDFKAFAFKGNVVDMAVGVIIATAFSKIVSSLVNDVFMPFISWLFKIPDFSNLNLTLIEPTLDEAGEVVDPGVSMLIGTFIQNVIDFFLVAVVVFLFVRMIAKLKKKEEEAPAEPPKPSNEEVLLTEIRDLLKEGK